MNTHDIELRSAVMGVITDVWDRSKQIDDAADEVLDLIEADRKRRGESAMRVGAWLSAALDDPNVCDEMKADIRTWMDAGMPTPQPAEPVKVSDDLAHEIWAAAQTAPGEEIEDAVDRVAALLARYGKGAPSPT